MTKVLILAGTAEARALSVRLAGMPGISAVASLAGGTSAPQPYAIPVRRGGFGGADGLVNWLARHRVAALIDATHPFAEIMQANARTAAGRLGIPHLRLLRPPWPARPGWITVADAAAAAGALPAGARVLLTSGRKDLGPFLARTDVSFLLRTIERAGQMPPHMRTIAAAPAGTREQEADFMRGKRITHLVAKNSGGIASAKLDAADALGVTTVVIGRPPHPPGDVVETVDEVVDWLARAIAPTRSAGIDGAA